MKWGSFQYPPFKTKPPTEGEGGHGYTGLSSSGTDGKDRVVLSPP